MIDTPAWVRDAVFYQIFPDRFAASDRVPKPGHLQAWADPPTTHGFKGGDLLGIAEHLPMLADLGITALYLTPIFASASNHRYHTYDYLRVDPAARRRRGPARAPRRGPCPGDAGHPRRRLQPHRPRLLGRSTTSSRTARPRPTWTGSGRTGRRSRRACSCSPIRTRADPVRLPARRARAPARSSVSATRRGGGCRRCPS